MVSKVHKFSSMQYQIIRNHQIAQMAEEGEILKNMELGGWVFCISLAKNSKKGVLLGLKQSHL